MFFRYRFSHHLYSFALYCLIFMEILCECFQFSDSLTVNVLRVRNLLRKFTILKSVWQVCCCFSIDMQQNILLREKMENEARKTRRREKLAIWLNVTKMYLMQQCLCGMANKSHFVVGMMWYKNPCGRISVFLTWFLFHNLHSAALFWQCSWVVYAA